MYTTHVFSNDTDRLPVYFVTCCTQHQQESICRPHGLRDIMQILFVTGGTGVFWCREKVYPLRKGSAFFLDHGVPHEYENTKDLTTAWITFAGSGCDALRRYIGNQPAFYCEPMEIGRYVAQIAEIEREYQTKKREGALSAITYTLLTSFFDEQTTPPGAGMDQVKAYMETNFQKNITVEQLAALYHTSKSTFCKQFKETYGCTSFEMLMEIRLVNARFLLQFYPREKIRIIAQKCGFADVGYFCKVYKKRYGKTPSEERI